MKKNQNETAVGIFVIIGFVLLSLVVFFVSGVYLFRQGYHVSVMYDYVSILDRGAPVRMAGVRIGEVSGVELVYDKATQQNRVKVKLFIEKGVEIRENYLFEIRGTHILSEPHIEISPRPGSEPLLKNEALIQGEDAVPIEDLIQKAHQITENLNAVLEGFRGAVEDPEGAGAVKNLVVNLSKLTASLEKALSGSEEDLKHTFTNLKESSDSLKSVLDKIEAGEGTAGKLLTQDELYQELRAFVAEIRARPWRLMKKDNGGKKFLLF